MVQDHSYFRKEQPKGQMNQRDKISKRQKKLEEEKNSSSTQAKGERIEKLNHLTTQDSFWCE